MYDDLSTYYLGYKKNGHKFLLFPRVYMYLCHSSIKRKGLLFYVLILDLAM